MVPGERLNFPQQLRHLRRHRGFTQAKLASLSGLSRVTISHIEQGHSVAHVTITTLVKLSHALGVTPDTLLGSFAQFSPPPRSGDYSAHTDGLEPENESPSILELLRDHSAHYAAFLSHTDCMIYTCTMSGELVAFNQTFESLMGYSREELFGKYAWELLTAPSRDISYQMRMCKRQGVPLTSYRVMVLTKHQQTIPVDVITQWIYRFSEPIGIQGVARRYHLSNALQ